MVTSLSPCTEAAVCFPASRAVRRLSTKDSGTMAIRKVNSRRWQQLMSESEALRAKLLGWSPGGTASQLGISRQAIHKAIHRGDLDAVIVNNDDGRLSMFMIPDSSLQAFKAKREQKLAG